jgi:hypothetical protein
MQVVMQVVVEAGGEEAQELQLPAVLDLGP